jgi:hypothetical protein
MVDYYLQTLFLSKGLGSFYELTQFIISRVLVLVGSHQVVLELSLIVTIPPNCIINLSQHNSTMTTQL